MHTHTDRCTQETCIQEQEYNCFKTEINMRLKINQILSLDFNYTVRFLYPFLNLFLKNGFY